MKKASLLLIPIFLSLIFPLSAQAFSSRTGDSIFIGPEDTTDGSLYAAGSVITIEGTVAGDLVCAGQTVIIKGQVDGSVLCAARSINIDGNISGNARLIAQSININGQIEKNLNSLATSIIIGSGANVGKEALIAGADAEIRGKVGDDLHGAAGRLYLSGQIGGDVKMQLGERNGNAIEMSDQAIINGNLFYTAPNPGNISQNAEISGDVGFTLIESKPKESLIAKSYSNIYWAFAALVTGLVLISLWRRHIRKITDKMINDTAKTIAIGFAVMFLTPLVCIILLITIIGLPLSLILAVLWLIALYVGKILAGILIGRSIIEKFWSGNKDSLIWSMILGISVFWILSGLPVIGWIISLFGVWWGLGGLWQYIKEIQAE